MTETRLYFLDVKYENKLILTFMVNLNLSKKKNIKIIKITDLLKG